MIQADKSTVADTENQESEPPCKRARLTDAHSESPEPDVKIDTTESVAVVDDASNTCTVKPLETGTAQIKNSTAEACDGISDITDIIHKLFLVKMPNDFYQFWEFCEELCPENPSGNYGKMALVAAIISVCLFIRCPQAIGIVPDWTL